MFYRVIYQPARTLKTRIQEQLFAFAEENVFQPGEGCCVGGELSKRHPPPTKAVALSFRDSLLLSVIVFPPGELEQARWPPTIAEVGFREKSLLCAVMYRRSRLRGVKLFVDL
jgi:hypothetical protein